MAFSVLTGSLQPHTNGLETIEEAMEAATLAAGNSPFTVAVVINPEENEGASAVVHDGYIYLGDAVAEPV